jgi:predicted amidohydrolase
MINTIRNAWLVELMLFPAILLVVVLLCWQSAEADSPANRPGMKVATCQFPVSGDVVENATYIKDFIKKAAVNKADIVHFSEAALSGYAGVDIPNFDNYDWDKLRTHTQEIMGLARENGIWVVLGSAHYLCPEEKPTNCLYVISNEGKIVDRYDKSMCTGGDLKAYTPGNHLVTIDLKGFRCGFLICYDSCFPEMYNVYRHQGVEVVFHSFYNARHKGKTILDEIIPAEIRVRASDNLMWVIANNSSADHSAWPACIARPDGSLTSLERGVPGILYRSFPDEKTTEEFPSWTHNNKAMVLPTFEVYHNGAPSDHPRATNRRALP